MSDSLSSSLSLRLLFSIDCECIPAGAFVANIISGEFNTTDPALKEGSIIYKIRRDHPSKAKIIENKNEIICPGMFVRFTNVYYFTTIVLTTIGYGAQFVTTTASKIGQYR